MSLKQIIITISLAILVGGGGAWVLAKNRAAPRQSPVAENLTVVPTAVPVKFTTWNDEAGFSFQYPEGLKVDNHPDDKVNYANLTITDKDIGSIDILMKDNTYKSIENWVNTDSIDTSLGGKAGKKMVNGSGETIIGVIDNGVLVTIKKGVSPSPMLETAWEKIIDSFEFVYPTPTAANKKAVKVINNQDSGENVLEEEN